MSPVKHQVVGWGVALRAQWSRQFAPSNLNLGVRDTITCSPGSISACCVTANTIANSAGASTLTSAAYRITDSGSRWRRISLPRHTWLSSEFSCSGPGTCAVGAAVRFISSAAPDFTGRAAMLSTEDGGRRWTVHDLAASTKAPVHNETMRAPRW